MKKLYVGNLPYEITEEEVSDAFGQFGTATSVKLITDRDTGRKKGFGFVEMESAEEAQAVVDELNGKELFGRTLKIDIAKDRPPRNGGGGGFNRGPRERNFNR
ncbi:MAG: RNA-binding protein [Bacteriovoracaceae bacterium]|nr:RNA-binding protein [Bacteriovoracaceae bacterium]